MDVVLELDVAQECQAVLVLEELPGVEQGRDGFGPCEYRQPPDHGTGQEVGERGTHQTRSDFAPSFEPRPRESARSVEDGIPTPSVGMRNTPENRKGTQY